MYRTGASASSLERLPPAPAAFRALIESLLPIAESERRLLVDFFHHEDTEAGGTQINGHLMALMGSLFEALIVELSALMDGSIKLDPTCVLVLFFGSVAAFLPVPCRLAVAFSVCVDELGRHALCSPSSFLGATMNQLVKAKCIPPFERFVHLETTSITEARVGGLRKRSGVWASFKTFPVRLAACFCFG